MTKSDKHILLWTKYLSRFFYKLLYKDSGNTFYSDIWSCVVDFGCSYGNALIWKDQSESCEHDNRQLITQINTSRSSFKFKHVILWDTTSSHLISILTVVGTVQTEHCDTSWYIWIRYYYTWWSLHNRYKWAQPEQAMFVIIFYVYLSVSSVFYIYTQQMRPPSNWSCCLDKHPLTTITSKKKEVPQGKITASFWKSQDNVENATNNATQCLLPLCCETEGCGWSEWVVWNRQRVK